VPRSSIGEEAGSGDVPALAAGLTTVLLWGSAFVAIRAAGEKLSPGAVALGRLLVASMGLSVVALLRREKLPPRHALGRIAAFGLLWLGVYSFTLNAAERQVDAGTAAMIVNTGPVLIALLAGFVLREGFPSGLMLGCAVALAGCILIGTAARSHGGSSPVGLGLLGIATLAYATAVIVQKAALARATAFQVTWLGLLAATVACLPFAPTLLGESDEVSGLAWVAYLGALPTALGFATWSFALSQANAGRVASLNYLIPVVAITLGWAFLHERPRTLALVGGSLCLTGVYLARRQPPKKRRLLGAACILMRAAMRRHHQRRAAPGATESVRRSCLFSGRHAGAQGRLRAGEGQPPRSLRDRDR
jgi:drug/metabolite transporter (DMT)-like permease